jgi:hypothetical protein
MQTVHLPDDVLMVVSLVMTSVIGAVLLQSDQQQEFARSRSNAWKVSSDRLTAFVFEARGMLKQPPLDCGEGAADQKHLSYQLGNKEWWLLSWS